MKDESKYINPATNPMIRPQAFEDSYNLPDDEPDGPGFNGEDFKAPLGGYLEKKAAAAKEKPEVEPGDFESKVKVFMDPVDEVIIVAPMGDKALFKISKRQCGTLEVIDPDGSRRTLADLDPEERKIINYNLYVKCAKGKDGECPCNRI